MYEQYMQTGKHFIDVLLNIPPAWYGLALGAGGVTLITFIVNKIVKVYTEITSNKVFAGIFLLISFGSSLIDYLVTNGTFDASNYGKNTALLLGAATFLFHGIKIAKSVAEQVKYYAPLIGTKAQAVKALTDNRVDYELPAAPIATPTPTYSVQDDGTKKTLGAF